MLAKSSVRGSYETATSRLAALVKRRWGLEHAPGQAQGGHHGGDRRHRDGTGLGSRRTRGCTRSRASRTPPRRSVNDGCGRRQPPAAWDGVRDASHYGVVALQRPMPGIFGELGTPQNPAGDDCLNLNVWTPDPGTSGLPVLVWIHGGAFFAGSGIDDVYNGAAFARDGVVTVTLNYRLGVQGFWHLGDLFPDPRRVGQPRHARPDRGAGVGAAEHRRLRRRSRPRSPSPASRRVACPSARCWPCREPRASSGAPSRRAAPATTGSARPRRR